jgi:hypothetical protein
VGRAASATTPSSAAHLSSFECQFWHGRQLLHEASGDGGGRSAFRLTIVHLARRLNVASSTPARFLARQWRLPAACGRAAAARAPQCARSLLLPPDRREAHGVALPVGGHGAREQTAARRRLPFLLARSCPWLAPREFCAPFDCPARGCSLYWARQGTAKGSGLVSAGCAQPEDAALHPQIQETQPEADTLRLPASDPPP